MCIENMGRRACCWRGGLRKGAWTLFEDKILSNYINRHGASDWRDLPRKAGLERCGKSCRLRWVNYLKPDLKRGCIAPDEEDLIIKLHNLLGNRWSLIAGRLPGRTDNEIKNHWNCRLRKRVTIKNKDHHREVTRGTRVRSPPRENQNHEVVRPRAVRCTRAVSVPRAPDHRDDVISSPIPRHDRDQEYDRDMFDLDLNGCYDPLVDGGDRDTVESSVLDLWICSLEEDLILRGSSDIGAMDLDFSIPNWAL